MLWRRTGGLTCHTPHLTSDRIKKSGRPYRIARLFFYFSSKEKQILYLVGVKLAIFIYICVVEYKNKKIIRLEDFET